MKPNNWLDSWLRRIAPSRRSLLIGAAASVPTTAALGRGLMHAGGLPPSGLTVNGSATPAAVVSGDSIWVHATNVPIGHRVDVKLNLATDSDSSGGIQAITLPSASASTLDFVFPLTGNSPPDGYQPLAAGNYQARIEFDGGLPIVSRVPLTVTAFYAPFQQNPNYVNGFNDFHLSATPTLNNSLSGLANVVSGTVTLQGTWIANFPGPNPANVTCQFLLNDQPVGSPVFSSTGLPTLSFDTTTKPDGTYILGCQFIDCNDTEGPGNKWNAYQLMPWTISLVILNGTQPPSPGNYPDPTGTYQIPINYFGASNRFAFSRVDFVTYSGLPQPSASTPYYDTGTILPTYNSGSQYFSNPAALRSVNVPYIYWFGGATEPRYYEYVQGFQFWTTLQGGIFSGKWIGHLNGTTNIESSYPVSGSFLDGPRNSNMTSNYVTYMAMPSAGSLYSGPFPFPSSYFWSGVQEDGRVTATALDGTMTTIAGPKRDTTQLPLDWTDPSTPEFPSSVPVGTIDTRALYSNNGALQDIAGAAVDICWDPRDPFICYTSSTVDHCINKINFHSQVIGGITYGPYTSFTGAISGTTLTVSGISATVLGVGYQIQSGAASGTTITGLGSGTTGNGTYTVNKSQTVGSTTMVAFNPLIQLYAGYKGGIAGDGVGGFHDGAALDPFTGGVPGSGYAQFNGIYSICQVKRNYGGSYPYPVGTMFVADNYNGLIRVVSAQTIDGNGNQAVVSTVSTLVGLHGGSTPPNPSPASNFGQFFDNTISTVTNYAASSITEDGGGITATVVVAAATQIYSVGCKLVLKQNGSPYTSGGGSLEQGTYGIYTVAAFTDSQHFKISTTSVPTTGTISIDVNNADTYSAPLSTAFASAYTAYPSTLRMASTGDIVLGEGWYNQTCRLIHITSAGPPATGTISRIGIFGDLSQASGFQFGWMDVDDADADPTAITAGIGACGPIDDIVCFKSDANPGSANTIWRISLDGTYTQQFFGGPGPFDLLGDNIPIEGAGSGGHYPWAFSFGKNECRIISNGLSDTGPYYWRPITGSDPVITSDPIMATAGGHCYAFGSPPYLPINLRPSFMGQLGPAGVTHFGQNVVPTIDELQSLTDSQLITFIQAGGAGVIPRPEFSVDDDHLANPSALPGRDLQCLAYYFRRASVAGSWPTQTPNVFDINTQGSGGACWLLPGSLWDLDYVRPNITITSATRVSNTSFTVNWTTDKNTIGIIIAGSPFSQVDSFLGPGIANYSVWTLPESTYKMTGHTQTITGSPDVTASGSSPTHFRVMVKDKAGNYQVTADQTLS